MNFCFALQLMITPPVNSIGNFITVLRMLSVISNRCPDLAQLLLQQNIAFTLSYLLTGSLEVKTEDVELVPRSPQEWFEITCLIEELMPPLPTDGIFSVNSLLERTSNQQETVHWEWRDERHCCHPFSTIDSRIIEVKARKIRLFHILRLKIYCVRLDNKILLIQRWPSKMVRTRFVFQCLDELTR